jgi:hypothetical protein
MDNDNVYQDSVGPAILTLAQHPNSCEHNFVAHCRLDRYLATLTVQFAQGLFFCGPYFSRRRTALSKNVLNILSPWKGMEWNGNEWNEARTYCCSLLHEKKNLSAVWKRTDIDKSQYKTNC